MTAPKVNGSALQQQIMNAVSASRQPMSQAEIAAIVQQVIKTFVGDKPHTDTRVFHEIEELARFIRIAKEEVAAIRPKEIGDKHIPTATVELDAVVGATEEATNKIMDECDKISAIAGAVTGEANDQLMGCVTRIYEACNFQDITGQRITKVVNALQHIEAKVNALINALGHDNIGDGDAPEAQVDPVEKLLNGPQLAGNATSQEEIDRLLNS